MEPFGELHYREFSPVTMFIRYFLAEKMFVVVRQKSSPFFKISRFARKESDVSLRARSSRFNALSADGGSVGVLSMVVKVGDESF